MVINISTWDYFGAGFEGLQVLDSMAKLEAYRDLPFQFTIADYVNGYREGSETQIFYPAGMLYEIPVVGGVATRGDLNAAIATAHNNATEAGFGVRGKRMFKLVLVTSEVSCIWVRVGNRWQE
ncbi:MAG: hypothetical protein C0508_16380 [Cyanobacteria bacterium PR.023]|nr:hypothetical protein [Cyanobacteria bacterium PR.023]